MIGRCIDLSASAASRIGEKSDYLSGVTYWTNPIPQQTSHLTPPALLGRSIRPELLPHYIL